MPKTMVKNAAKKSVTEELSLNGEASGGARLGEDGNPVGRAAEGTSEADLVLATLNLAEVTLQMAKKGIGKSLTGSKAVEELSLNGDATGGPRLGEDVNPVSRALVLVAFNLAKVTLLMANKVIEKSLTVSKVAEELPLNVEELPLNVEELPLNVEELSFEGDASGGARLGEVIISVNRAAESTSEADLVLAALNLAEVTLQMAKKEIGKKV